MHPDPDHHHQLHVTPHRRARTVTATTLSLAAAILLTGCTTTPATAPSSTVTTHWKDGVEPVANDLEDTDYVRYLRDLTRAKAIAWNTGDFAIPELLDRGWRREASGLESDYARQGEEAFVYLAPQPFVPLEIRERETKTTASGSLTIVDVFLCIAPETEYKQMVDPKLADTLYDKPSVLVQTVTTGSDGSMESSSSTIDLSCDDTVVPVALFAPAPELPDLPVEEANIPAPRATE